MSRMHPFSTADAEGTIFIEPTGVVYITGRNKNYNGQQVVSWLAAAPVIATESWMGSGLPYPNRQIAMEGTPSKGTVVVNSEHFEFRLPGVPGAFYTGLGTKYVPPFVRIDFVPVSATVRPSRTYVQLTEGVPFRSLSHPTERRGPEFYGGRDLMPIRSAEQILRDSAHPNGTGVPVDFWGGMPPQ